MRLRVVAESPADFDAWEQRQLQPATIAPEVTAGAEYFRNYTCVNCHSMKGGGPPAHAGPDLTHFASRATIGAGVLANTPANVAAWLKDPQASKPGCFMPNFKLRGEQLRQLAAYLETLK